MKRFFVRILKNSSLPLAIAVGCLFAPGAAQAGTITGVNSTFIAGGLGFVQVPAINTLSPGNDNQPGSGSDNNLVVPIKRFDATGYIDIQFNVTDDLRAIGTTEYIFSEFVDNNTGINWSGYTMQLGSGIGPQFVSSPGGDGLDFDAPNFDTLPAASAFTNVVTGEDLLSFSTGTHSTGMETYQFRIDVPDGITSFTLRQFPIPVPEPSTLVLAGFAALGLVAIKRRRNG
jgi:hypothetical protein